MNRQIIFLLLCAFGANAQSFRRASIVLQMGSGIEAYETEQSYVKVLGLNDTTINSAAASRNLYGAIEIGLSKRLGIAARGRINYFFRDVDELIKQRTTVNSSDLLFAVNLHPIVRRKFDLLLGAEAGFSTIDMSFERISQNLTSGRGTYASVYIEPRIYRKRFGFHVRASLPVASYKNMNTVSSNLSDQKFTISDWKGSGFGLSAGIQLRLF